MNILTEAQFKELRTLRPIANSVNNVFLKTYESEAIELYILPIMDAKFFQSLIEENQKDELEEANTELKHIVRGCVYFHCNETKRNPGLCLAIEYLTLARFIANHQIVISQNSVKKQNNDLSIQASEQEVKRLSRDCLHNGLALLKKVCNYISLTDKYKRYIKDVDKVCNSANIKLQVLGE